MLEGPGPTQQVNSLQHLSWELVSPQQEQLADSSATCLFQGFSGQTGVRIVWDRRGGSPPEWNPLMGLDEQRNAAGWRGGYWLAIAKAIEGSRQCILGPLDVDVALQESFVCPTFACGWWFVCFVLLCCDIGLLVCLSLCLTVCLSVCRSVGRLVWLVLF